MFALKMDGRGEQQWKSLSSSKYRCKILYVQIYWQVVSNITKCISNLLNNFYK